MDETEVEEWKIAQLPCLLEEYALSNVLNAYEFVSQL
jgi:hypothetical protein